MRFGSCCGADLWSLQPHTTTSFRRRPEPKFVDVLANLDPGLRRDDFVAGDRDEVD